MQSVCHWVFLFNAVPALPGLKLFVDQGSGKSFFGGLD